MQADRYPLRSVSSLLRELENSTSVNRRVKGQLGVHGALVVDLQMASELKSCGSPTIRINGPDIAEELSNTQAFSCCPYPGSQQIGLPPIEMVRPAVAYAHEGRMP